MTFLASEVANLPLAARHEAFRGVADCARRLPADDANRMWAAAMLSSSIPALPHEHRDDATRQVVDVLRPLTVPQREFVLNMPDDSVSPAIKDALRQAITNPGRTG